MSISEGELRVLTKALEQYETYKRTHRAEFWEEGDNWYPWQHRHFAAGATHRERMVLAGNRTGKTLSSTYEVYLHATGRYPEWWTGLRFEFPPVIWCLGVDAPQVKDVLQSELFGILGDHGFDGTGWVEERLITGFSRSQQLVGLARDVNVKHISGGNAVVSFRAYTQSNRGAGTTAFAGSSVDFILVDEQPSDDELHGQLVTRTMTGNRGLGGSIVYSMTPELGETELVHSFLTDRGKHQFLTQVTWDDCPHLTPELQEEILASIPEWQHEMRKSGMPFMGSGRIYKVPESRLKVAPFEIPSWWTWIGSIDFGIDHPTAWGKLAYDREHDVVYLTYVYAESDRTVPEIATHIRKGSEGFIPTVYPHDGDIREKGSGDSLATQYRDAGVEMNTKFHNLDKDKTNYVEPGIKEMDDRMKTDRFKVFDCPQTEAFWPEYRRYHRDEKGKRVDKDNDVLDMARYGTIMIPRYGRTRDSQAHTMTGGLHPQIEV